MPPGQPHPPQMPVCNFPSIRMRFPWVACLATLVMHPAAATDLWELPPIRYSETQATDPVHQLAATLGQDPHAIPTHDPLERLRFVLRQLKIPEESQILVFSKTSKQNALIHPGNPRSIFFNENAYVGYVPGGDIEVISPDPGLGPIFYVIPSPVPDQPTRITRQTSSCLSCHGTARTESVPGVLVRSVFPDETGQPRLELGSHLTTHRSPITRRWGGYYVTGTSSLPHMGNQTFPKDHDPGSSPTTPQFKTVPKPVDPSHYLRPTSDIVALMVLEHQCHLQNLMTAAEMNYRRFLLLRRSLHPEVTARDPVVRQYLQQSAAKLVPWIFFEGEAELGPDGIEGDPKFQAALNKRFPKSHDGRSLADFQLYQRLFKYPCSYMVYSKTFRSLSPELKSTILSQMHQVLSTPPAPDNQPQISASARRKILSILEDTLPDWPKQ